MPSAHPFHPLPLVPLAGRIVRLPKALLLQCGPLGWALKRGASPRQDHSIIILVACTVRYSPKNRRCCMQSTSRRDSPIITSHLALHVNIPAARLSSSPCLLLGFPAHGFEHSSASLGGEQNGAPPRCHAPGDAGGQGGQPLYSGHAATLPKLLPPLQCLLCCLCRCTRRCQACAVKHAPAAGQPSAISTHGLHSPHSSLSLSQTLGPRVLIATAAAHPRHVSEGAGVAPGLLGASPGAGPSLLPCCWQRSLHVLARRRLPFSRGARAHSPP